MMPLEREIAQCLQCFGPMTAPEILTKMNLRRPQEPLTLACIQPALDSIARDRNSNAAGAMFAALRVNRGLYVCNRAVGDL